jgi:ADP-heptose:LPS heptosyltransferase
MSRKLVIVSNQALGDAVVMTAAVRDLKTIRPDWCINIHTRPDLLQVWDNNPHLTRGVTLDDRDVQIIKPDYRSVMGEARLRPIHFIAAFHRVIGKQLGFEIPVQSFRPDLHIASWERRDDANPAGRKNFWVVMAGGKSDMTVKWWPWYQKLVDLLRDRVSFVQAGAARDHHPALDGALDLRGRTDARQFIRLIDHADGVVCPITAAMHIAAGLPGPRGGYKPAVVIAGGREEPHWEAYPGHQYIHTVGQLECCSARACYRSAAAVVDDLSKKRATNRRCLNLHPGGVSGLDYARCMTMISPEQVAQHILRYEDFRCSLPRSICPTEGSSATKSCGTPLPSTATTQILKL